MQSAIARLFLFDQISDDQFLGVIQDSSKRQEQLRQLEEHRIWATRSLAIGLVLAVFVLVLALFGNNSNINFGMILAAVIILDARAQYASADARIKLIKLYSVMTQKS